MDKALFNKASLAISQSADIAEMVNYELGKDEQFYSQTVDEYDKYGVHNTSYHYMINHYKLLDHIEKAKHFNTKVEITDTKITITIHRKSGTKAIATYVPINE